MERMFLKSSRVLWLQAKLVAGDVVNKDSAAREFQVDARTIQRDIDSLRDFYADQAAFGGEKVEIIYDRKRKGYRLEYGRKIILSNAEVFVMIKILLESRSLENNEMMSMIEQLIHACIPPAERKQMKILVQNEMFHYIEPRHGKKLIDIIWKIGGAVCETKLIQMCYRRVDGVVTQKIVKPVGIMNSEYYFYLAGFEGESERKHMGYPTIYRIDRIIDVNVIEERFRIPEVNRFKEGEFRKRVAFMYSGPLEKVEFVYKGPDINAVLDKLPTSEYVQLEDGSYKVKAEVYGRTGIEMWLRSQGTWVEVIYPAKY